MSQLDQSVFSGTEFTMSLSLSGAVLSGDYGFSTVTIPGMSDPTTQQVKLNNDTRKIITSPGTDNNFTFETTFTKDFFKFRQAAKDVADYSVTLTGKTGSAFAGYVIEISGKVASPGDLSVGVDSVPTITFNGSTSYINAH